MQLIDESLAIAEKEVGLSVRYILPFFTNSLISPLIKVMPFLLVYGGFFSANPSAALAGHVKPETFIPFLFLGITADIFFSIGYSTFSSKFMVEKWWQTMEIIILAPINKLSLITGIGLGDLISTFPTLVLFLGLAYYFTPLGFLDLIKVLIIFLLLFMISLSIGLITSCAALFNENLAPFFGYLRVIISFVSAFYYPIEVLKTDKLGALGQFLPVIATFNPLYQANFIIRAIWFEGITPINSVIYVLFFAIISPIATVYVFNKLWSTIGIQGY